MDHSLDAGTTCRPGIYIRAPLASTGLRQPSGGRRPRRPIMMFRPAVGPGHMGARPSPPEQTPVIARPTREAAAIPYRSTHQRDVALM